MVALMEAAAVACIDSQLAEGQETLGVRIDVEHIAATPIGLTVTATAELIERDGRKLVFNVEAHDAREIIGRGRHTRIVVDSARFRAKAEAKRPA
jgi:predicted thioesterase